jgi:hypothetical protein
MIPYCIRRIAVGLRREYVVLCDLLELRLFVLCMLWGDGTTGFWEDGGEVGSDYVMDGRWNGSSQQYQSI